MRRCITLAACERPKNSRTRAIAALIVSLPAFVLASPVPAVAQDAAQLAALDAKIANLENENATFKKRLRLQALEKENAALKKQLGMADDHQDQRDQRDGRTSISREQQVGTSRPLKPDVLAAYAMKEPRYPEGAPLAVVAPPPPLPVWTGFYTGASFGVGWLRAQEFADNTNTLLFTNSNSSVSTNPAFSSSNQSGQLTVSKTLTNMTGADLGGIANLHLGFAGSLGASFVGGLQFEGGLSNIRVRLTGTGSSISNTTFNSTSTCSICTPVTTISNSTSSSSGTQTMSDTLASRWQVSALARGGFLIDPYEMVYLIGGWTYAGFETLQNNAQLGLNGGTIGAGYERQVSPLWGIKVEYRYTKFASKTVDLPSTSTSIQNFPGNGSSSTSVSTSYINTAASYSANMQTVMLGVSRYFGP
jgi:opacity protein-like surface antigen